MEKHIEEVIREFWDGDPAYAGGNIIAFVEEIISLRYEKFCFKLQTKQLRKEKERLRKLLKIAKSGWVRCWFAYDIQVNHISNKKSMEELEKDLEYQEVKKALEEK